MMELLPAPGGPVMPITWDVAVVSRQRRVYAVGLGVPALQHRGEAGQRSAVAADGAVDEPHA
jgi:hypothetical protein